MKNLNELLKNRFPSALTRRIELDDQFFTAAQQFSNENLDFSHYPELEQIVNISKVQGVIKRIDVSQNPNLTELNFSYQKLTRLDVSKNLKLITLKVNNNQLAKLNLDHNPHLEHLNIADNEITGVWEFTKCSKLKFLSCRNNYLNELRINKDLRYLLVNSDWSYLQPQKHDKARVHPLKNITYITPLEGQNTDAENNAQHERFQSRPPQKPSWKSFYRWLQAEIIENDSLQVKLKFSQQANYRKISENALNRFVNSLEATLDDNSFFHLFPAYDDNKSFDELFNFNKIFCGKKSDKKKIGEASYGDLEKLFYNWKKASQGETGTRKSAVSKASDAEVRNILLIGRTGSGKSTLANVLVNKNNRFEEIFRESAKSISETKNIKAEKFSIDLSEDGKEKINYQIIDTIGFGDTKLSNKQVLELLQDLVPIVGDDGLNQILFVTDGRFTEKEIETYKLLENIIFDKEVANFTTIVRVRFPEFEDREECDEDRKALREENEEMFRILKNSRIVYVDNPPLVGRSLDKNKEIRVESNKRLLTYLATCQSIYYPANLAEFKQRIDDYRTESEWLEKELAEKEQAVKDQEEKFQHEVQATQTKQQIDLELSRRKFQQKLKTAKDGYEWKLKYTQEQLEKDYQNKIRNSQQRYERDQAEAESRRKAEIERIKSNYENRRVRVGEAVCSLGHSNVTGYNSYGCQPDQDDFEDSLSYVYCSTCGRNDYNYRLINARAYNFEEWCRMRNQSYANELAEMKRQIQEQERIKQEALARLEREKRERDTLFEREFEREKQLQDQVINQEKRVKEEILRQENLTNEGKITLGGREKINRLNTELSKKRRELEEHRRQSQIRKNASQQRMNACMEQLLKS